ncbi:unnamed protein product [Paramecium sonneborni]|uniref:non-specific serine/threonine protein kinase n=1 Tax=Paramecium sonneborni TaxID=65129 RepID=A0A8S1MHQ9_9CILI|nr:unnamed protein product [Paramecium sonneborni]
MQYSKYIRIKSLGEGAYGKAFLVKDAKDGSLWVQKQIDVNLMTEKERIETYREFKVLQQLQHPNIIKFRDVYLTTSGKLCIIMEFADRGDLGQIIKSQNGKQFPQNQILDWFTQICLALKHVHDRKILHRDLKCQNIFLTKNNRIKLGDFGIARVLSHTLENAKTQIGTPYYISPEMIESKPYSYASDIWSLGIVLYEMCMLKPPFEADSLPFLCLKICKGTFNNISSNYSPEFNNIVKQLLQTTSNRRPTINKILKIPLIVNRIKEFLSQSVQQNEFSHTILHQQKINIDNNVNELKVLEDLPKPPNLIAQQQQSSPINQNPVPLKKANNSTPNNIQNTPKPSQPKQQQQAQKLQPQKRERSFTPQKNQIKKQNNIQVSKNNPIINLARNDSKKKVAQVQSNNQIPQTKRDSQVEQNQQRQRPMNNVSSPSLQLKQPLQKPQLNQQSSQQQLKQQQPQKMIENFENLNEYDDTEQDVVQMDYGIKFEQSDEKNAIEDAKICAKMEEALIEKDEVDEQFEQQKKQILESEGQSDIRVEEEEVESSLEKTKPITESSQLSFLGKTNGVEQLKIHLEQVLGANKMRQAIQTLINELNTKPLEEVEKNGQNYYQKLLPFLSLEERKNFVLLLFQLIVLTK